MGRKKQNNVLTLEDIQEAVKKMADEGGKPSEVYMTTDQYDALRGFFDMRLLELEVGDWVFIDNVHVGEVTEVDTEDITTEYIVNILESAAAKKPIVLRISSVNTVMKVPKGSKLKSLLVLHGR